MLSELQVGYLAGLLDGEGQVSIVRNIRRDDKKRLRNYSLRTEVRIGQRRRVLLDTVIGWIGQDSASITRYGLDNKFFQLRFRAPWLKANLPNIAPHLTLKRRQAELVIEFLNLPTKTGRIGLGEKEWAKRDQMRAECMALNLDRTNAES